RQRLGCPHRYPHRQQNKVSAGAVPCYVLRSLGRHGLASEPKNSTRFAPADLSWEDIDRLEWQLWGLAVALVVLLGVGVLSFMLPTVFWFGDALFVRAPQRAFYGLCILLGLTLAYLLQKRMSLARLRQALAAEHK